MTRALVLLALTGCTRVVAPSRPRVLWFGGDVHFGAAAHAALDELSLDGPLVVNLEGPVSEAPRTSSSNALFNPPESADLLKRAHVVAAGIDNNHSLDDGADGLVRTRTRLERAGIAPLGSATVEGLKLLQVDLSGGLPAGLEARLREARPQVVLFHVLAPPLFFPEPVLREAAEVALRSGAAAVIAHGSHSLAPIERRGSQVIAWGLGNLAFDCECTTEDEGLLVRLEFAEHQLVRASVVPVRAGLHGARAQLLDSPLLWQTLENLGSSAFTRRGAVADF